MGIGYHKTFEEQLNLLIERGIQVGNREKALKRLKNIGYYKIKEFAEPFFKTYKSGDETIKKYDKIYLEAVVNRFYQDKNLRNCLLHSLEKVELSFKTYFAYLLGEKDPYNYLNFNFWCNKEEYCKHYIELKNKEFKRHLKKLLNQNKTPTLYEFYRENKNQEFPPIWIAIEVMSFGDIINLFELMSNKNRKIIARNFNCTDGELESWLNNLKFIRNKCAHNCNIIDLKIHTKPRIKNEWKELLSTDGNTKIASVIIILNYLVKQINEEYEFGLVHKSLKNLIRKKIVIANKLGFKTKESINFLFEKKEDIIEIKKG